MPKIFSIESMRAIAISNGFSKGLLKRLEIRMAISQLAIVSSIPKKGEDESEFT
jgi:hypothetical protein